MSYEIYALERCETYGLSPELTFRNQLVISTSSREPIPGFAEIELPECTLYTGSDVQVIEMKDAKGRLYGAFVGVGVDRGGARVTAEGFRAFNSKSPLFAKTFAKFVGEIAGRFAVVLDAGKTKRLFTDPLGHMGLFFNPQTRRVSTAEYLTLDRAVQPGPFSGSVANGKQGLSYTFPMGYGLDAESSLLLGGHALDLTTFETERVWPANMSLRKVTRSKSGPVIEQMAKRLKTVVGALARSQRCSMALEGTLQDRLLLAALKASDSAVAQVAVNSDPDQDSNTLDLVLADRAGCPLTILSLDEARKKFANDPPARQALKRLYWVRTGCALRVPKEELVNLGGLRPRNALAFKGEGFDALQGGWTPDTDKETRAAQTLDEELAVMLGHFPQDEEKKAYEDTYKAWKSSMPKSFQSLASDFVRLEMHQPAQAIAWHGEAEHFPISPFSDRYLIEHALRLPSEMRRGPALVEALLEKLAPELANLPYAWEGDAAIVHAAE